MCGWGPLLGVNLTHHFGVSGFVMLAVWYVQKSDGLECVSSLNVQFSQVYWVGTYTLTKLAQFVGV